MSNLIKPYEISVWDDVWNSTEGKFEEKRLGIIGTHTMDALTRALEPNLTRNVNGTKKLTFKMYKYYKDTITGEQMENPFVDWLVSERKVKLKYGTYIDSDGTEKDRWYDFIIKNINENSSNYQYTYQLEDALVQELSKNGFATTLDQQLMNNTGTAKELSERVLEGTDWTVESEKFVQTIDENLIYVYMPAGTYHQVEDQSEGHRNLGVATNQTSLTAGTALAFYSSCKNKPHRFQFIRLGTSGADYNKGKITRDDKRFIDIDKHPDCQYFIDVTNPETGYTEQSGYFLPSGWSIATQSQRGYDSDLKVYDTVLSNWYRGKRYGYSQVTKYIPAVDKYCKLYKNSGVNYYGFVENEYTSPALIKNVITNPEFSSTTGWTGTYYGNMGNIKSSVGAKVENVYGRFVGGKFSSVVDELANGTYDVDNDYTSYLKITFPPRSGSNKGIVINSGFYDQRTTIGSVSYDEQWYFGCEAVSSGGAALSPHLLSSTFSFKLREVDYNTTLGNYTLGDVWAQGIPSNNWLVFNSSSRKTDGYADVNISAEDFKKKNIRLVLELNNHSESTEEVIYLKKMELFKRVRNAQNQVIKPGELEKEGIVKTYYKFFPESQKDFTNAEEMVFNTTTTLDYETYVPVYVEGAEKVRSITAKESNYFNILQSIAETFECWVDLKVKRSFLGAVEEKTICLKNYIGKDNFASFRYGVNLKDIQRTFESKNIVTKLLVKQNSNEHAENGFCTIARAGNNPTGENYIYDFQYFHGRDILDVDEYNASMYYATNPFNNSITQSGLDVGGGSYNVQNYVNRVKAINEKIKPINEDIIDLSADLTKLTAELKVQEGLRDAAQSSLEEVTGEFLSLTGLMPDQISAGDFTKIVCTIPAASDTVSGANKLNNADWATNATVSATQKGAANSTTWEFNITLADTPKELTKKAPRAVSGTEWSGNRLTCDDKWEGLEIEPAEEFEANGRYVLEYTLQKASTEGGVLENIGAHMASFRNVELWVDGVKADENPVNITDDMEEHTVKLVGTFYNTSDLSPYMHIQPNRGSTTAVSCIIKDIKLSKYSLNTSSKERTFKIKPTFTLTPISGAAVTRTSTISCTIPADSHTGTHTYSLAIVDTTASSIAGLLQEYAEYGRNYREASAQVGSEDEVDSGLAYSVKTKKAEIEAKDALRETYLDQKAALNKCFYEKYSRFIQEGTWISEEYIDDDKYYADALSVLYNSCYPQVTYSINVISLKGLPGYEHFDFEIGDKTFAVDPEFFGEKLKEEVIIAEMSERLDDPSKNTIKVQNFKNQFQDLFQKITATVQQAQYSTGAYEKAAALAEADEKTKNQFVNEGLSAYASKLSVAGQTTVVQDESGITLTDSATQDQMRLIGGAILMSKQDPETGLRGWKTGLTPEGISASYVTAGVIDAGKIQIKNVNDPVFIWNTYGLSAFDADWYSNGSISKPNPYKFVRFDKYGIYGINTEKGANGEVDGITWKPSSPDEIDERATFALTWEGLKVTGSTGGTARLGKQNGYIMLVQDSSGEETFGITEDGRIQTRGIEITDGTIGGKALASQNYADGVASTAKTQAIAAAQGLVNGLEATLGGNIEEVRQGLQDQIDGNVSTYFLPYLPKVDRYPIVDADSDSVQGPDENAKGWDGKYMEHNGDLFYVTAPNNCTIHTSETAPIAFLNGDYWIDTEDVVWKAVLSATGDRDEWHSEDIYFTNDGYDERDIIREIAGKVGFCYRWEYEYSDNTVTPSDDAWVLVKDTEVTKALADAARAQGTADGKATIFSAKPEASYQYGDLIIPVAAFEYGTGSNKKTYALGKVYRCKEKGEHTSFNNSHWEEVKYTDDTSFNNFVKDSGYSTLTALTNEISNGQGIFSEGLSQDATKTTLNNFGLQAGSLVVYDKDSYDEETGKYNIIFSAQATKDGNGNPTNGAITLAGWTVTSNQLTTKKGLGVSDSYHMYPSGKYEDGAKFGQTKKTWSLGIGAHFGVTTNGGLYCTSGNIGNWTIDSNAIKKIGAASGTLGVNGEYYTRSGTLFINAPAGGYPSIELKISPYYHLDKILDDASLLSKFVNGELNTIPAISLNAAGKATFNDLTAVSWTNLTTNAKQYGYLLGKISTDNFNSEGVGPYFLYQGEKRFATEEAFITDLENSFHDAYKNATPIFYVTHGGKLYAKNIEAAGGTVGSFTIGEVHPTVLGNLGLFSNDGSASVGLVSFKGTGDGHVAIWAGANYSYTDTNGVEQNYVGSPWQIAKKIEENGSGEDWSTFVPFYVEKGGKVRCSKLDTNIGTFEEIRVADKALAYDYQWRLSPDGLHYERDSLEVYMNRSGSISIRGDKSITLQTDTTSLYLGDFGTKTYYRATKVSYSYSPGFLTTKGTISVTLYFDTAPVGRHTLYYYVYSSKKDNQQGSWSFTGDGSTKTFSFSANSIHDYGSSDEYVGFSVKDSIYAMGKAVNMGHGIRYSGDITIDENVSYTENAVGTLRVGGNCVPYADDNSMLGISSRRWKQIWAIDTTIDGSDRKLKKDISAYPLEYETLFDNLKPVRFRWIKNDSNRYHAGFISQEVEEAILSSGLSTQDFAGFIKYAEEDGQYGYGLRHCEFISLNTWQIQKTKARVTSIEEKLLACEAKISSLEQEIENLKNR